MALLTLRYRIQLHRIYFILFMFQTVRTFQRNVTRTPRQKIAKVEDLSEVVVKSRLDYAASIHG